MINIQEERKTIYNKPHQKGSNSVTNQKAKTGKQKKS